MKLITTSIIGAMALSSAALAGEKKDIVDTAVAAGSFKTLVAAVKAAGLVDTLKGEGPFTVFAPTDEAFAKLPAGTVESLLKPENKDKLVDILTYHVVAGKVPAKKALKLSEATAVNKKEIKLQVKDGSLFLNESKVVKTDIKCTNGIIHVIDAVLLPPAGAAATQVGPAQEVMAVAINKGVPLFNHGDHAACAAVYEMAAMAIMKMPEGTVSCSDEKILMTALQHSKHSGCATTRAWTMRKAFDKLMVAAN
ncbi:MAG: fasciclin domain-containing protein [Akkermansiaceae bacterium]|nr:fasciclin domain-containing protein [Akkermansiaceae bacterium]